jgi:hypothetical protein
MALAFFVVLDGVRIAKQGGRTPQAGTWVSLEPSYEVTGGTSGQDP